MKRGILTAVFAVIAWCALSVMAHAGSPIRDEYLDLAGKLRVRAATEMDAAKRDEMLSQAEEYEQMAEAHTPPESEFIFKDGDEADAESRQRAREELDKMQRDYERTRGIQKKIDERICASCKE
ncbi:MAG: hypothetical protein HZB85_10590 [Deltaproteobacteria bacterium]|nr:hypothetical protein [Deltaproteobacteria bacterium]